MTTARRMTFMTLAVLGVALSGATQTASQKCADAVRGAYPDEATVWVVSARGQDDHTELSWQSASGGVGVCRMELDGRITDVKVTGRRPAATPREVAAAPEEFEPYRLTCESEDGSYTTCDTKPAAAVTMVEQLGDAECTEGVTWGQEDGAVWVDRGCRATFEVSPRRPLIEPLSQAGPVLGATSAGQGVSNPRFQETRAQDQCRALAASRYVSVVRFLGARVQGSVVLVLMEVQSVSRRQEVTCLYDTATDQAVFAR